MSERRQQESELLELLRLSETMSERPTTYLQSLRKRLKTKRWQKRVRSPWTHYSGTDRQLKATYAEGYREGWKDGREEQP